MIVFSEAIQDTKYLSDIRLVNVSIISDNARRTSLAVNLSQTESWHRCGAIAAPLFAHKAAAQITPLAMQSKLMVAVGKGMGGWMGEWVGGMGYPSGGRHVYQYVAVI